MEKIDMMTANQVARLKGISRQAVGQAIRENRLPAVQWGRFWVVSRSDAEQWQPQRRAAQARKEEQK